MKGNTPGGDSPDAAPVGINRRRLLVNKKVQLGYALAVAWTVVVSIGVTATTVYYTLASVAFEPANRLNLDQAMARADWAIFWRLTIAGAVLVVASMLLTVYFMHRLVGPVYRMEQILRTASAGSVPSAIKLRRNDEFQSLAASMLDLLQAVGASSTGAEAQPEEAGIEGRAVAMEGAMRG